ncbi:MAG: hypothetical protein GY762_21930 [Proteobacteria bacterium]|nr:hypothetical protein [Pseudomonadota bacterium]
MIAIFRTNRNPELVPGALEASFESREFAGSDDRLLGLVGFGDIASITLDVTANMRLDKLLLVLSNLNSSYSQQVLTLFLEDSVDIKAVPYLGKE